MSASVMTNERLVELLVQQTTEGLSASEILELRQLLASERYDDADQFDQTAAALVLAAQDDEPLPPPLRRRLLQEAERGAHAPTPAPVPTPLPRRADKSAARDITIAWFAAAACLILAILGWWPRFTGDPAEQEARWTVPPRVPTMVEQRNALLTRPGTIKREWTTTDDLAAAGVSGDVVWDPSTQSGFMRFRGLAANNPLQRQYQLWIFDATRGDTYPVDGGVFDVPADATEVVVPIRARLQVRDAAMFAVTLEKAGGVVVSDREHVLVLAKTTAG